METISGTAQVIGVSPEVMDRDPDFGSRIPGTTLRFEGFEVGDDIIGWVGSYEVTVTSTGMYIDAVHPDAETARAAAEARATP